MKRQSSYGTVGLTPTLACLYCKCSISKAIEKGVPPKRIKKCIQPWEEKWDSYRKLEKSETL